MTNVMWHSLGSASVDTMGYELKPVPDKSNNIWFRILEDKCTLSDKCWLKGGQAYSMHIERGTMLISTHAYKIMNAYLYVYMWSQANYYISTGMGSTKSIFYQTYILPQSTFRYILEPDGYLYDMFLTFINNFADVVAIAIFLFFM